MPPVPYVADKFDEVNKGVKEMYCCIPVDSGPTLLQVRFNKNVFFANEIAYAEVRLDQTNCKLDVREIGFQVQQHLTLRGVDRDADSFTHVVSVLEEKDTTLVRARAPSQALPSLMALNLANLISKPDKIPPKKNGEPYTPEEVFLLTHLPPATNSTHIQNRYELNVNIKYDTDIDCCSEKP